MHERNGDGTNGVGWGGGARRIELGIFWTEGSRWRYDSYAPPLHRSILFFLALGSITAIPMRHYGTERSPRGVNDAVHDPESGERHPPHQKMKGKGAGSLGYLWISCSSYLWNVMFGPWSLVDWYVNVTDCGLGY